MYPEQMTDDQLQHQLEMLEEQAVAIENEIQKRARERKAETKED